MRTEAEWLSTAVQRLLVVSSTERDADQFDGELRLSGERQFQT